MPVLPVPASFSSLPGPHQPAFPWPLPPCPLPPRTRLVYADFRVGVMARKLQHRPAHLQNGTLGLTAPHFPSSMMSHVPRSPSLFPPCSTPSVPVPKFLHLSGLAGSWVGILIFGAKAQGTGHRESTTVLWGHPPPKTQHHHHRYPSNVCCCCCRYKSTVATCRSYRWPAGWEKGWEGPWQ